MVNRIESLAGDCEEAGFLEVAKELREIPQRHPDLPGELNRDTEGRVISHLFFDYLPGNGFIRVNGQLIPLTGRENQILAILLKYPNKIIPTKTLIERAFGPGYDGGLMRAYIYSLRRKIEPVPEAPQILINAHHGYYLFDESKLPQEGGGASFLEEEEPGRVYNHPAFDFYLDVDLIVVAGKQIHLTPTESKLLTVLARNDNRFLPRSLLMDRVWPEGQAGDSLKVYMRYLREKIEPGRKGGRYYYLVVEREVGYKLFNPIKLKAQASGT